ncbi:NADH-quinone oxidoreductase subunit A [Lyticum sinuosum]|uniref:NADH-quinone oxidoreductase subunit n=1 Tax=Lyticum sinuosum TaxID=1332059 RepID=A0AAE5AHX9_9RICK|nr:NADH-quinone oxidoreductase subunit A [Lyticum sinuosum]MDZ5761299.1 NADH-quinone oxidoreductase subunit A [Lyticum sinuosum]
MQSNTQFIYNYSSLFLFLIISLILACIMLSLPFFIKKRNPYKAKNSSYECGFNQVGNNKNSSNIRFYFFAILFLIFDIEIIFLVPWALTVKKMSNTAFYSGISFIFILALALIYEWKKGILDKK